MPPRTRKTAAPAPSLEDAADPGESAPQSAAADAGDETAAQTTTGPAGAHDTQATSDLAPEADAGASGGAPTPAGEPAPTEQTYHWESVNGDGSEPCRHCPPGTPPPGAGSYGCPHGQWVRVQDTT